MRPAIVLVIFACFVAGAAHADPCAAPAAPLVFPADGATVPTNGGFLVRDDGIGAFAVVASLSGTLPSEVTRIQVDDPDSDNGSA